MEKKHIFVLIKFLLMQDPLLLLNPQKKKLNLKWVQCFATFQAGQVAFKDVEEQANNSKWQNLDLNLRLSNYRLCCKPLCYTAWQVNNTHPPNHFFILTVFTVIELNYALLKRHQRILIYKDFLKSYLEVYTTQKKKYIL